VVAQVSITSTAQLLHGGGYAFKFVRHSKTWAWEVFFQWRVKIMLPGVANSGEISFYQLRNKAKSIFLLKRW